MRVRLASVFGVLLLLVSSCSASTEIGPATGDLAEAGSESVVGTDDVVPDVELSSEEVYETIEPSIVYVQAPDGLSSGSGIVIDGGWVLTNAHVVDRHESVRIGRSDGEDLGLHVVHAVDWAFDLALVGPIVDLSLTPIERGESSALLLGSRVMLAGFPDEDSVAPTPTVTEGIVSRRRFVALGDYPFLQVDATIAPGQSGGALVNTRGELVGISGLEFGEGEFGLVFASDPMWPRIDDMIAKGGPGLPSGPPEFELAGTVGPLRNFGFMLEVEEGTTIDMAVTSAADVWVDIQTLGGITVSKDEEMFDPFRGATNPGEFYFDDLIEGGEDVIADIEAGTYQVLIGSFGDQIDDVEVTSVNPLRSFADVEEASILPLNQVVEGDFDWVRDTDTWKLPLDAGQTVVITVDGISDTLLVVSLDDVVIASSDDEGLGLWGTGAQLEITATEAATYSVEVGTFDQTRWGYLIEAAVS